MPDWLESLGYFGAFLGAILEGEILLLAFLQSVRLGYLHLPGVALGFYLGTLTADWSFFLAARRQGRLYLQRFPKLQHRFEQGEVLMEKSRLWLLLGYRFLWGFRIVLPILFGLSSLPTLRFMLISAIMTLIWLSLYIYLGLFFSELLLAHLPTIASRAPWVLGAILIVGVLLWRKKRQSN